MVVKLTITLTIAGINYGHDPSVQFKDADVIVCIGLAREYEFTEDEYLDPFFKDYILTSKYYVLIRFDSMIIYERMKVHRKSLSALIRSLSVLSQGEAIESYAKKDARIIVIGSTAATIISRYVKSIPSSHITALSMFNFNIATAHVRFTFHKLNFRSFR